MTPCSLFPVRLRAHAAAPLAIAVTVTGLLAAAAVTPVAAEATTPAFTTSTLSTAPGTGPTSIVSADLDGDGDLDLATANYASQDVTVLTQESDGSYTAKIAGSVALPGTSPGDFLGSLRAVDVDGDGDLDLVVPVPADQMMMGTPGYVVVLTRAADDTYTRSTLTVPGDPAFDPRDLVAADLDGDGDVDFATANFNAGTITTFTRAADGSYAALTFPVADYGTNPAALVAADLDGDGHVELVVANDWPGNVAILTRRPDGSYTSTVAATIGDGTRPRSLVAADLDGDGDLDLATGNYGSHDVSVLTRAADGSYTVSSAGGTNGIWPIDLRVADLDGDGDLDLVTLNSGYDGYGDLTTFTRGANGSYATDNPGSVNRPTKFAMSDLDGDGDADLAIPDVTADTVTVFTNTVLTPAPLVQVPAPALANATSAGRGTGAPFVGDTLTAASSAPTPADATVTFQWFRVTTLGAEPIPGATGSSYTLGDADLGAAVRVVASGAADSYRTGHASSATTGVVVARTLPAPQVAIGGTAKVGVRLTAVLVLPDVPGAAASWQWQSVVGGTPTDIPGATSDTFTPAAAQSGHTLRAVATLTAPDYPAVVGHADTAAVAKGTLARPTVTITGTARQGRTLTAKVTRTGVHPAGYRVRYVWKASGRKIAGATGRTLTLGRRVVGRRVTVTVTTTAPGYTQVAVTSRPTAKVARR